jgi:anti-sigma factor ChrR (cupin superfamily)
MSREQPSGVVPGAVAHGSSEPQWMPFRTGIEIKRLFKHPDTGYEVAMLRYAPGASAPLHRHRADEHVFVLCGNQCDERGTYGAGSYVYNAAGTCHSVRSEGGCEVLIHWLAPVDFL